MHLKENCALCRKDLSDCAVKRRTGLDGVAYSLCERCAGNSDEVARKLGTKD